jgi:hypothetical protein
MLSRDSCNPSSGCAWRYNKCTKSTSAPKLSSRVIPKFPAYHFLQMTPLPQLQQPIRRIQATVSTVMKKRRKIARPSTALALAPAPAPAPVPVSTRMPQLKKPSKKYGKSGKKTGKRTGKTTIIYYPRSRSRSPFRQERRVLQTRLLQQLVKYNSRKEASAVSAVRKSRRRMAGTSLALSKRVQKLQKLLKGKRRRRPKTLPLPQLMQRVPQTMQQKKQQKAQQVQEEKAQQVTQQQKAQQAQEEKKQQQAQQVQQQKKQQQAQQQKKQQQAQQQKKQQQVQQAQQVQPSLSPEIIAQGLQQQRSRAPEIQVQQQTTSSKPVIIQQQGRKPATAPIIIQQQERRSKTAPIIIQQQERRSKTAPIIIQQQERRSKTAPIIIQQQERRSKTAPIIIQQQERRSRSAPIIIQQQRRSSSSPVYVSSLGHSVPGFLLSPGMPGYPMMPGMMPAYPGMPSMFARQQEKYRKAFEQEMKKLEKARADLKEKQQRAKRAGDEAAFKRAAEQLRRKEQESKRTIAQVERRAAQLAKKEKQMEKKALQQRRKMEFNMNSLIQDISNNAKLTIAQKEKQIKNLKEAAAAGKSDILRTSRQATAAKYRQGVPRILQQRPPPPRPTGPKPTQTPTGRRLGQYQNVDRTYANIIPRRQIPSGPRTGQYQNISSRPLPRIPSGSRIYQNLNTIEKQLRQMANANRYREKDMDELRRLADAFKKETVTADTVRNAIKRVKESSPTLIYGDSTMITGSPYQTGPSNFTLRGRPLPQIPQNKNTYPSQQVKNLKAQIQQLSKRPTPKAVAELQEQLSTLQLQLAASSSEIEALRKAAAGSPVTQAVTAVSQPLKTANAELQNEIQKLNQALEDLKKQLAAANQQGETTKSQLQANKRVSQQLANVNARFNQLNRLHSMMEVDFAGMANKLTKTQARHKKQAQEFQRTKTEMTFSAEDIAGKLKEAIETNKTLEATLQEQEREMKDRIKELETAINALQSAPSPVIEPFNFAQNAAAVQQSKKKDTEINRLNEELERFQEDLKNLHSSNDDHKKARQEAEKKVSELKQALSEVKSISGKEAQQRTEVQARNADLLQKLKEATNTLEKLKQENKELVEDRTNIEKELVELNEEVLAARRAKNN